MLYRVRVTIEVSGEESTRYIQEVRAVSRRNALDKALEHAEKTIRQNRDATRRASEAEIIEEVKSQ